jgi:hypothetical protein
MVMIIHRARRDIARCRRKYGDAWTQYEKEVPYLFIPVSLFLPLRWGNMFPRQIANGSEVYHLEASLESGINCHGVYDPTPGQRP